MGFFSSKKSLQGVRSSSPLVKNPNMWYDHLVRINLEGKRAGYSFAEAAKIKLPQVIKNMTGYLNRVQDTLPSEYREHINLYTTDELAYFQKTLPVFLSTPSLVVTRAEPVEPLTLDEDTIANYLRINYDFKAWEQSLIYNGIKYTLDGVYIYSNDTDSDSSTIFFNNNNTNVNKKSNQKYHVKIYLSEYIGRKESGIGYPLIQGTVTSHGNIKTDLLGFFNTGTSTSDITISGGVIDDIMLVNHVILTAPSTSDFVTPLTTIAKHLIGLGWSAEDIRDIFGLGSIDLFNYKMNATSISQVDRFGYFVYWLALKHHNPSGNLGTTSANISMSSIASVFNSFKNYIETPWEEFFPPCIEDEEDPNYDPDCVDPVIPPDDRPTSFDYTEKSFDKLSELLGGTISSAELSVAWLLIGYSSGWYSLLLSLLGNSVVTDKDLDLPLSREEFFELQDPQIDLENMDWGIEFSKPDYVPAWSRKSYKDTPPDVKSHQVAFDLTFTTDGSIETPNLTEIKNCVDAFNPSKDDISWGSTTLNISITPYRVQWYTSTKDRYFIGIFNKVSLSMIRRGGVVELDGLPAEFLCMKEFYTNYNYSGYGVFPIVYQKDMFNPNEELRDKFDQALKNIGMTYSNLELSMKNTYAQSSVIDSYMRMGVNPQLGEIGAAYTFTFLDKLGVNLPNNSSFSYNAQLTGPLYYNEITTIGSKVIKKINQTGVETLTGDYIIKEGSTYPSNNYNKDWKYSFRSMSQVRSSRFTENIGPVKSIRVIYQITPTTYNEYELFSVRPQTSNAREPLIYISGSSTMSYEGFSITAQSNSVIPLIPEIFDELDLKGKYNTYAAMTHLHIYAGSIVKTKWYQTSFFTFVMFVVAVVVAYIVGPEGLSIMEIVATAAYNTIIGVVIGGILAETNMPGFLKPIVQAIVTIAFGAGFSGGVSSASFTTADFTSFLSTNLDKLSEIGTALAQDTVGTLGSLASWGTQTVIDSITSNPIGFVGKAVDIASSLSDAQLESKTKELQNQQDAWSSLVNTSLEELQAKMKLYSSEFDFVPTEFLTGIVVSTAPSAFVGSSEGFFYQAIAALYDYDTYNGSHTYNSIFEFNNKFQTGNL